MRECSKSIYRRLTDSNFVRKYFVGCGIDIGGKPDPLCLYREFFPLMKHVRTWDLEDGDAQFLDTVPDSSLDFVHSSHCLEHLINPYQGIANWFRVLKDGGYLVVTVPDEDLYEQGVFPSTFNRDHKWTFTIFKTNSWSGSSVNVVDLLRKLGPGAEIVKVEQLSSTYRFDLPRYDQTITPLGEAGIEFIVRKRSKIEIDAGEALQRTQAQPEREARLLLNQYKDDISNMKQSNQGQPPFTNDSEL